MDQSKKTRDEALAQLKQAQQMIAEGRKELAVAQEKIWAAQDMIDESAAALRNPPRDQNVTHPK